MKKISFLFFLILVVLVHSTVCAAAPDTNKALEEKRLELNGTTWTISVKPMGVKGLAETDVITLSDGKFSSQNMQNAGFAATAFTLRVKTNGTAICETMQRNENGDTAFWRLDILDDLLRGVMSKTDSNGRTTDFALISK